MTARNTEKITQNTPARPGKDLTKYLYKGNLHGKGRLVLAVVNDYVSSNPGITFDKLKNVFPDRIIGPQGVFSECHVIKEKFAGKANNHHFMKPAEIISLEDCDITVCVDWSVSNIHKFVDNAKSLGIKIEVAV